MNRSLAGDPSALLHNMSAPPKSVVRYSGLSGLAQQSGPGGSGVTSLRYSNAGQHGLCVRFELAAHLPLDNPTEILASLGLAHEGTSSDSAARHLVQLINRRAAELCVVEPNQRAWRVGVDPNASLDAAGEPNQCRG